jgi:hypothetical protein
MGPYTQLLIRRTGSQRAVALCCLEATARRLGWLDAFPTAWSTEARVPGSSGRRPWGAARIVPQEGGDPGGAYLAFKTYRKGSHPRLRFRTKGPWARRDLEALRAATTVELSALVAGGLRWKAPAP